MSDDRDDFKSPEGQEGRFSPEASSMQREQANLRDRERVDASRFDLAARLRERIKRDGPITFHDWMQAALYDPAAGYYSIRRIRQGRRGDYRTAPETSPLFGGVFAHYFMKTYFDFGAPDQMTIIEAGAGAGDFARAVLTTLAREFPRVFEATHYIIDEISHDSRSQALTKLVEFRDKIEFRSLLEIERPLPHAIIFSNELIDAFPVNRAIGRNGELRELYVGLDDDDGFIRVESNLSVSVAEYCERIRLRLAEGQVFDLQLDAERFVSRAAEIIGPGLLITVDYGAERNLLLDDPNRFEGTLRAFHKHNFVDDLLSHPGAHDLTATVDWTQMQEAGARCGFETLRLQRLDEFLMIEDALGVWGKATIAMDDPVEVMNYNTGARELILPGGMAAAFQVLIQRKVW